MLRLDTASANNFMVSPILLESGRGIALQSAKRGYGSIHYFLESRKLDNLLSNQITLHDKDRKTNKGIVHVP